jgi:hypothetical protein
MTHILTWRLNGEAAEGAVPFRHGHALHDLSVARDDLGVIDPASGLRGEVVHV